jgi:hypothetical protein
MDDLFKPRSLNSDHYSDSACYVPPIYDTVKTSYIEKDQQLHQDLQSFCKNVNPIINELYLKRKFLTSIGKPEPLKRWVIDSAWDIFEMEKLFED